MAKVVETFWRKSLHLLFFLDQGLFEIKKTERSHLLLPLVYDNFSPMWRATVNLFGTRDEG